MILGRRTDPFPLRKLYFIALRAPDVKSHIKIARKMITLSVILAQFTDLEGTRPVSRLFQAFKEVTGIYRDENERRIIGDDKTC